MTEFEKRIARFDGAVLLLPQRFRPAARTLTKTERAAAEEIRLRTGQPLSVVMPEGEMTLKGAEVTRRDIDILFEIATEASGYSFFEQMKQGFITVRGGYRIGICGSAAMRNGEIVSLNSISSAAIRISREIKGVSDGVIESIRCGDDIFSTLILSPPGGGKTTLLRDIVRSLSDGGSAKPMRVSLADERSEIAASVAGTAQMDVGAHTDIMDSCPKAEAITFLMRSMNPQVIALDEITSEADINAIIKAANCGVRLIATAHADGADELKSRPLYRKLLGEKIFSRFIFVTGCGNERHYETVNEI